MRQYLRRVRHAWAIKHGSFGDDEPLFDRLHEWVHPGDVAVDVGAAVGTYTVALSGLVGSTGWVIALEPLQEQLEALLVNMRYAPHANITALQLAASGASGPAQIAIPRAHGKANWYMSHLVAEGGRPILCAALDDLPLPRPVRFLKIDAEGSDVDVLKGAAKLIAQDAPVVFAEDNAVASWLFERGYAEGVKGCYNTVYLPATTGSSGSPAC